VSDPVLYYSPGACSLSVHAALRQAQIAHTAVRVDVRAGEQLAEGYRAINPRARVPALVVDAALITEVLAIASLIDGWNPDAKLFPRTLLQRARALSWISHLASAVHPLYRAFWRAEHYAGDCDDARVAVRDTAVVRLSAVYAEIEAAVARHDVFSADAPGFLDLYTAVFLRWAQALPDPPLGPALIAYRDRLAGHAPLAAALDAEGVSLTTMKRRSDP
jgi:glutathione S-transferase